MKNKFFKRKETEIEVEENEEEVEVSQSGPSIASSKNNKLIIIAASSLLITLVIYFIFFKGSNKKQDKLEEVAPVISAAPVAKSDSGKSPFELEEPRVKNNDIDILDKPKTPEVPKLPELPASQDIKGLVPEPEAPQPIAPAPVANQPLPIQMPQVQDPNLPAGQNNQAVQAVDPRLTDPKYAPILVVSGPQGPANSVGYENNIVNLASNSIQGLEKSKVETKTTFVENRANVVAQGKLILAVLETAINTEIPGNVRAIVSRDVYGEAGNHVLISRGSRLYGSYSANISRGQGRVQITWTRLIRPDGVDLAISSSAADQFGRAGISGSLDNRYGSVITNSILSSILAVSGVAAAEALIGNKNAGNTTTVNPTLGTTTTSGNASTQAVYNVSKTVTDTITRVINDNLDLRPVIKIPQGTKITILVNADMKIPSLKQ